MSIFEALRAAGHWVRKRCVAPIRARAASEGRPDRAPATSHDPDVVDVRRLIATTSLDDINASAERYFARLENVEPLLAQPFCSVNDAPAMLIQLAAALHGLQVLPDHHVLDFGAGSCWASRFLTQMGCKVYALDVSATALTIGAELFTRQPVIGPHHTPEFLHFDGRTIPLPDASVDRILCLDAFHHVPNVAGVLHEMGRVLKPGGLAAFSEPGPAHSLEPQSQYEMKHFKVVENDVVMSEIWTEARRVGFVGLSLALFDTAPPQVPLDAFDRFLDGSRAAEKPVLASMRTFLQKHRTFFLLKAGTTSPDSRRRGGLQAEVQVRLDAMTALPGTPVRGVATIRNTSDAVWLPTTTRLGAVLLGGHLLAPDGSSIQHGFFRAQLTPGQPRAIGPGEVVEVAFELPPLLPGHYLVEFDMVSESVCWFATNGSRTVRVPLRMPA